jgi:hypothetical protein
MPLRQVLFDGEKVHPGPVLPGSGGENIHDAVTILACFRFLLAAPGHEGSAQCTFLMPEKGAPVTSL